MDPHRSNEICQQRLMLVLNPTVATGHLCWVATVAKPHRKPDFSQCTMRDTLKQVKGFYDLIWPYLLWALLPLSTALIWFGHSTVHIFMGWWQISMRLIYFAKNKPSAPKLHGQPILLMPNCLPLQEPFTCNSLASKSQVTFTEFLSVFFVLHCWNLLGMSWNCCWLPGGVEADESVQIQRRWKNIRMHTLCFCSITSSLPNHT